MRFGGRFGMDELVGYGVVEWFGHQELFTE